MCFGTLFFTMENRLPCDGIALYFDKIFLPGEANRLFDILLQTISWRHEEAVVYGKYIVTKRKVAWYGDKAYSYTYSGITKEALPWTKELLFIKQMVEEKTGETFNSCLLNLYHNGEESMGWHSDNESSIEKNSAIASVSFGAERAFSFRHKKTKETVSLLLENGSLLLMKDTTQQYWHHSLLKSKKVAEGRINLTFRCMKERKK